jgi:hypothetical protein
MAGIRKCLNNRYCPGRRRNTCKDFLRASLYFPVRLATAAQSKILRWRADALLGDFPNAFPYLAYVGAVADSGYHGSHDVKINDGIAYACCYQDDTLHVIDVKNPENPSIIARLTDRRLYGIHDIVISGNYAYVTCCLNNSIVAIDISTPTNPSIVGELVNNIRLAGVHALCKRGNYIYAGRHAGAPGWFSVIDASDPADLKIVGSVSDNKLTGARGCCAGDNYVYVAGRTNGYLCVIDINTPTLPTIVGSLQLSSSSVPTNIRLRGNYAFITAFGNRALRVVNISNPSAPSLQATVQLGERPGYIELQGDYAFVGLSYIDTLLVVDISDSTSPSVIASFHHRDLDYISGISVWGKYLLCSARNLNNKVLTILEKSRRGSKCMKALIFKKKSVEKHDVYKETKET